MLTEHLLRARPCALFTLFTNNSSFHLPNREDALTSFLEIRSSRKGLRKFIEFTQLRRMRIQTGPAASGALALHDFAVLSPSV